MRPKSVQKRQPDERDKAYHATCDTEPRHAGGIAGGMLRRFGVFPAPPEAKTDREECAQATVNL